MIGIDLVPVERLRALLQRSEGIERRLFTDREREYCSERADPVRHLAGTLAAKEAVIKALHLGPLHAYARRIEVARDPDGVPYASIEGHPHRAALSISHDGGVAVAVAVATPMDRPMPRSGGSTRAGAVASNGSRPGSTDRTTPPLRPNAQLVSYLGRTTPRPAVATGTALTYARSLNYGTDFP